MDLNELPGWIASVIVTLIGTASGFFVGKRKKNADADSVIIDSAKKIVAEYRQLQEDQKQENELMKQEIKELKGRVQHLEDELEKEHEKSEQNKKRIAELIQEKEALEKRLANGN